MDGLSVQHDIVGVAVLGTAIALFFWLMRALAAHLISVGGGGAGESLGRAIASVYA